MKTDKWLKHVRLAFFGLFAIFTFTISHLAMSASQMSSMGMGQHGGMSSRECKVLCTTATIVEGPVSLLERQQQDEWPAELAAFTIIALLSVLAVRFTVKILIGLSSWRPPDRVLLYGRYADGL